MYELRKATSQDAAAIRRLIWLVQINPTGLNWRHFRVAVGSDGQVIACGQIKPHAGNLLELASIAVRPEFRSMGIARKIIGQLLDETPSPHYLYCRSQLQPFYERFGFSVCVSDDIPPYFRRVWSIARWVQRVTRSHESLLVMYRS